jgi:hypothetical protein
MPEMTVPVSICLAPAARLLAPPGKGEVLVCPQPAQKSAPVALSRQVLRDGPFSLPHGGPPIVSILCPPAPCLDDLLAAYLSSLLATAGAVPPPSADLLCEYAAHLREGLLPGTVPPERSLAGTYLALMELHRDQPQLLVSRGVHLLRAALAAVQSKKSLLNDDLFSADEYLSRERTYLAMDRTRYVRDRDAGQRFHVRIGHLRGHLLLLRHPTSILFRLFAHHDKDAPGGDGFDLLAVERAGQGGRLHLAFFADPRRRLPLQGVLGPLCQRLDRLERRRDPAGPEPWYDGRHHQYQRLASPRRGTAIPRRPLLRVLLAALGAAPVRARPRSLRWLVPVSAAAGVAVLAWLRPPDLWRRDVPAPVVRGDWQQHRLPVGPPVSTSEREAILGGQVHHYALLVAASDYAPKSRGGLGPLRTPWRDACVLRDLLVRRFGYRNSDVVTLADSPCLRDAQGPPSRERMLWTLEHLPVRPDDTLLFYYAGHGAIEDEPGGRYGYLQPGGWEARDKSREDRGLRMRTLAELLRDKVAARHQLLLIDACHSGETAIVRGGDDALDRLDAPVRADWRERPVYAVITATRSVDLALEERLIDSPYPHSLFMRAVIEGLSYAKRQRRGPGPPDCRLRADTDPAGRPDGLLTDGELFKYVARRLPELRAPIEVPGLPSDAQSQEPEWNPWAASPRPQDGPRRIGEFMLVPHDPPGSSCDDTPEPEPESCRPELCPADPPSPPAGGR